MTDNEYNGEGILHEGDFPGLQQYILDREDSICGEHHLYQWPDCTDSDHDKARELLAIIEGDGNKW